MNFSHSGERRSSSRFRRSCSTPWDIARESSSALIRPRRSQTSASERDPWKRLERTLQLTYKITFGTREEALEAVRRINLVHENVHGIDEVTGLPYDARDPDLLLWVHACLVDSQLLFERMTVGALSDPARERYHQEQMTGVELLGLDRSRIPPTVAELRRYIDGVVSSGSLRVTPDTMRVADLIRHPPADVPWRPVLRLVSRWAFATLPGPLRTQYGVRRHAAQQLPLRTSLAALKLIRPMLPQQIREIFPARVATQRTKST